MRHFIKENTWLDREHCNIGWGNGYVCIPKGHKYYGVDYDSINADAHGGLTFASKSEECDWIEVPEECKKDHWIVGFDTAHYGDTLQTWPKIMVELEAKKLAKSLK